MNLYELPAEPADLYLGLGNLVYALAKLDGRVEVEEGNVARRLLKQQPFGRLALHAFFLLENCEASGDEAYAFAIRRFSSNRPALTEPVKQQFVAMLTQIAGAHNPISRKEAEFITRFRHDLDRL